jgi:hypothetical protein
MKFRFVFNFLYVLQRMVVVIILFKTADVHYVTCYRSIWEKHARQKYITPFSVSDHPSPSTFATAAEETEALESMSLVNHGLRSAAVADGLLSALQERSRFRTSNPSADRRSLGKNCRNRLRWRTGGTVTVPASGRDLKAGHDLGPGTPSTLNIRRTTSLSSFPSNSGVPVRSSAITQPRDHMSTMAA